MRPARLIAIATVTSLAAFAAAAAPTTDEVLAQLAAISRQSGGTLGVTALHMKSGERIRFNATERFPMASTFKVPLAIKVLDEVDRRALALDLKIDIDQRNLSPGSGELKTEDPDISRQATVAELLELTMRNSDNTATDHLLAKVGGPAAVTRHVRAMGIDGLTIDRPAMQLVADSWGFKLPPEGERTRKNLVKAQSSAGQEKREQGALRTLQDPRDTSTPDAMVAVLERIVQGKALGRESTALLLHHMENCRTGPKRLKGELPRGMPVAHKTGTLTRVVTNDVGIITLPFGGGPIVIAVFLKGSPLPIASQEHLIATAALAVYRRFS